MLGMAIGKEFSMTDHPAASTTMTTCGSEAVPHLVFLWLLFASSSAAVICQPSVKCLKIHPSNITSTAQLHNPAPSRNSLRRRDRPYSIPPTKSIYISILRPYSISPSLPPSNTLPTQLPQDRHNSVLNPLTLPHHRENILHLHTSNTLPKNGRRQG